MFQSIFCTYWCLLRPVVGQPLQTTMLDLLRKMVSQFDIVLLGYLQTICLQLLDRCNLVATFGLFLLDLQVLLVNMAQYCEVIQPDAKKSNNWHFQHHGDYFEQKFFCNRNNRPKTISEQILKTFGQCQNCQYQTFKQPYQLYESK